MIPEGMTAEQRIEQLEKALEALLALHEKLLACIGVETEPDDVKQP